MNIVPNTIMIKSRKQPSAQDLYKARKQREEEERNAYLPPGLINHGNTCFMNSTLQGLIATPFLYDLTHRGSLPSKWRDAAGALILSRRSPLLTNGHGLGGQNEQGWVQGMPLGDVFLHTVKKAWRAQDTQSRESISPKEILTTIGRKYDQYMDFQQQDAHEFLRHLLDAMRMEEVDIIKKRQPPPPPSPKHKRRKILRKTLPSSNATPSSSASPLPIQPAGEDKLESFVDMLFGGRLASILVCEKCKKVSLTYEDFNDLSLSIKPEDYVKERKRDRLKLLAKKLRFRGQSLKELSVGQQMHRSSSVPASPVRRSMDTHPHEEPPANDDPRRRSLDIEERPIRKSSEEDNTTVIDPASLPNSIEVETKPPPSTTDIEDPSPTPKENASETSSKSDKKKKGKDKDKDKEKSEGEKKEKDDAWGKLGRRISVSMKMGKKGKRMSRSMHRGNAPSLPEGQIDSLPPSAGPSSVYDSSSDVGEVSEAPRSRAISPVRSPLASPPITVAQPFADLTSKHIPPHAELPRAKSPRPKPSRQESAYMRRILADIHPTSPSAFSMFHHAFGGSTTSGSSSSSTPITAQAFLSKLGHLPGIEECLRMFTAVEVLDGDNRVGCHRCWKIANGTYKPRTREEEQEQEEEEKAEDHVAEPPAETEPDDVDEYVAVEHEDAIPPSFDLVEDGSPHDSSVSSPDLSRTSPVPTSFSASSQAPSSIFLPETSSISSAPTTLQSSSTKQSSVPPLPITVDVRSVDHPQRPPLSPATYGGLPIPSISTTGPESPLSVTTSMHGTSPETETPPVRPQAPGAIEVSPSDDSLLTPHIPRPKSRQRRRTKGMDESSISSDEESDDGSESDASGSVSGYSDASSVMSPPASPDVSPRTSTDNLPNILSTTLGHHPRPPMKRSETTDTVGTEATMPKVPRSQQVIMRRTYKRYLIATPPPILMIHLKRFQQIHKTYAVSFSGGFKKLDDFVAFPEYLDLTPYLAPKKEDFGVGKKKKGKEREKDTDKDEKKKVKDEKCMYRLYAAVVHIGNMLGGHYVAYTALPSEKRSGGNSPSSPPPPKSSPSSPSLGTQASSSSTVPSPPLPPPASEPSSSSGAEQSHSSTSHKQHRQWAYISDTVVRLTTLEEVLKAKAYICMYERI
ncbi:Ubiquitin carboxyl-terminal hydrolase [Abortiporus biennis]